MRALRPSVSSATAVFVLSTTSAALAQAVEYYIDPAGNDSNDGTSPETAFASPAALPGGSFGGGSAYTAYFKRGGRWEIESMRIASGVTLSAYGEGSRPLLEGISADGTANGFALMSLSGGATVIGLEIKGAARTGFTLSGSGNHVEDCFVNGVDGYFELGFGVMGTDNLIIGNYVSDLSGMSGDSGDMNTSGGSEAYMIMGSNNEIAYNSAINCWGNNQTLGGAEGGCLEIVNGKADSVIENVYFHHNYCERSVGLFEGCSGNFQGTDAIQENHGIIRNSYVAYNLAVDAMWLYLLQPVNTDFENLVFEHNTIVHGPANGDIPQQAANSFGLLVNTDQGYEFTLSAGDITVRNNLFVVLDGGGSAMMSPPPAGDHYNNIFSPSAPMGFSLGDGEFAAQDPGLTADYRLAAGSPAIDVGSPESLKTWTDLDGNPVPLGAAPDVGVSEFCDGDSCSAPLPTGGTSGSDAGSVDPTGGTNAASGGADTASGGAVTGVAGRMGATGGGGTGIATGQGGTASTPSIDATGGVTTTMTAGGTPGTASTGNATNTPAAGDATGTPSAGIGSGSVSSGGVGNSGTVGSSTSTAATGNTAVVDGPDGPAVGIGGASSTATGASTGAPSAQSDNSVEDDAMSGKQTGQQGADPLTDPIGGADETGCACRAAATSPFKRNSTLGFLALAPLTLLLRKRRASCDCNSRHGGVHSAGAVVKSGV